MAIFNGYVKLPEGTQAGSLSDPPNPLTDPSDLQTVAVAPVPSSSLMV